MLLMNCIDAGSEIDEQCAMLVVQLREDYYWPGCEMMDDVERIESNDNDYYGDDGSRLLGGPGF